MPANNLPLQLSSFIGREREIAEVQRLLASSRLVTLTGAGGCGKTRLALEAASALGRDVAAERQYADGVWFVDLAPLSDAALVAGRIAAALSVREQVGQPLLSTLDAALRSKGLLLVVDNCEHLIAECARVVETLLQGCSGLHILATSREPLNIGGETTFIVPSLSVPTFERAQSFEPLSRSEAIRLFVERAAAARPAFALTPQNARAVSDICRRLDGMPLALELAAARMGALSAQQIAQRLDGAGIHFRSDVVAGVTLGQKVGSKVVERAKGDGAQ